MITVLIVVAIILTTVSYCKFIVDFFMEEMTTKKEFFVGLIPMAHIFKGVFVAYKKLK